MCGNLRCYRAIHETLLQWSSSPLPRSQRRYDEERTTPRQKLGSYSSGTDCRVSRPLRTLAWIFPRRSDRSLSTLRT